MPPEKVADHVWVMRQPDRLWAAVIGNVTIVEQSDGVVLIDSGGTVPDGREVVEAVAQLTPKPIKAVAITHWHNDHPFGVPAILDRFPERAGHRHRRDQRLSSVGNRDRRRQGRQGAERRPATSARKIR